MPITPHHPAVVEYLANRGRLVSEGRMKKMTAKRRRECAAIAANARWGKTKRKSSAKPGRQA